MSFVFKMMEFALQLMILMQTSRTLEARTCRSERGAVICVVCALIMPLLY